MTQRDNRTATSRRRFLLRSASAGVALVTALGALASCAPAAPTAAPTSAPPKPAPAEPTKPAAAEPTKPVAAATKPAPPAEPTKPAAAAEPTKPAAGATGATPAGWTLGKVKADNADPFAIMSWEGKGKIEKWQLGIDSFFKTFYPKMKVQFDWGIPFGDYWTKVQTTIASGAPLDFCWMHDTRSPTFANLGLLQPMDDYLKSLPPMGWPDRYYPTQVEAFRHQGKQYAFPYDWAPGAFYVNVDMLQASGVEMPTENWTFDDLLAAAQKMTKTTGDPKTAQWGVFLPTGSSNTDWITRNFGGEQVTGSPPTSHFDNPKTVAAYQYLYDLIWKHKVMPNPEELQVMGGGGPAAFASGKVGLVYALNDASNSIGQAVGQKFKISAAPTPKGKEGKRVQFVGGSAFSIPKGSPHPDAAYELARWILANPDNLKQIGPMGAGGTFVSNMDFWEFGLPPESTGIPKDAFKKAFYDLGLKDGVEPNYFIGFLQWDPQVFIKNMSLLWAGQEKDVGKVVNQVHTETVALLKTQPKS